MGTLARYHAANLPELLEKINRNSIGLDDYLNRFWDNTTTENYPPYNLIQISNAESRLEIALAGFKKDEVSVYRSLENYMWKAKKKNQKRLENLSIKDWPSGRSVGAGQSQMIPKYEEWNSPTDSCWYNWER